MMNTELIPKILKTMVMINIGMGEGCVARAPEIIVSGGLGSCVVLTLYDVKQKIGGMAHIMLPYSIKQNIDEKLNYEERFEKEIMVSDNEFRFADTAVLKLTAIMRGEGANIRDLVAKIAGGARMFEFDEDKRPHVGEQNIVSAQYRLKRSGIPLIGKDTGGRHGRCIEFYLDSGKVVVKAIGLEDRHI